MLAKVKYLKLKFRSLRFPRFLSIAGLFLLAIMPFALFVLLLPEGGTDEDPTLKDNRLAFPYTASQIQAPPTDFLPEASEPSPPPAEASPEPTSQRTTNRRRPASRNTTAPPPPPVEQPVQVIQETREVQDDTPGDSTPDLDTQTDQDSDSGDDNGSDDGFLKGDPTGLGQNDPPDETNGPASNESNPTENQEAGTNESSSPNS